LHSGCYDGRSDTDSLLALGLRFDRLDVNFLPRMVTSFAPSIMPCARLVFQCAFVLRPTRPTTSRMLDLTASTSLDSWSGFRPATPCTTMNDEHTLRDNTAEDKNG